MKKRTTITVASLAALLLLAGGAWYVSGTTAVNPQTTTQTTSPRRSNVTANSRLETLSYQQAYEGKIYDKELQVYLPDSYQEGTPMNVLYLLHGSTGDSQGTATAMQPILDRMIADGQLEPMIVVFPTYYPDRSFVTPNYSEDYPLNHFFATDEIDTILPLVEGTYTTYAGNTDPAGLEASRHHRAFGGYSMGGITTWDMLVEKSNYFGSYMPMAGDSWIDRVTNASGDQDIASTLVSGLESNNYGANDFRIIAMVGENDGTKYSMLPQIDALRRNHGNLITDQNLLYWENAGGGHSQESFEAEVEHGLPLLFGK